MPGKFYGDANANRKPERLIGTYAVTGTQFDSSQITVDTTTGTITITNHGLNNGDKVGFNVAADNSNSEPPRNGQGSGTTLYVINSTTNTFQLSTSSGGSALSFTTTGSGSGWKLSKYAASSISFSNIPYKRVRLKLRGWALVETGASGVALTWNGATTTSNLKIPTSSTGKPDFFDLDVIIEINNTGSFYTTTSKGLGYARGQLSNGGVNIGGGTYLITNRLTSDPVNVGTLNITFYGAGNLCSGTTAEVYALE